MVAFVQSTASVTTGALGLGDLSITTTGGNALIAVVGAHVQASSWEVSAVFDDANNEWVQLNSKTAGAAGATTQPLVSVWLAVNAAAVTRVRATLAGPWAACGVALRVFEISGLTNASALDVTAAVAVTGTTITPSATTINASDLLLAAVATASSATISHTADSWTTVSQSSADGGSNAANTVKLNAAYRIVTATGAQSTTWTAGASTDLAAVLIAVKGGSTVTTNPNPYWPQLATTAAFGVQPNASSAIAYNTDVSVYVRQADVTYGAPYELGDTEAGSNNIVLYNQDGRFDPTNASSPYSPNVRDYTPFKQVATWSGVNYGVFCGYMERWPLEWDDALTGITNAVGVDAWATLARVTLKACMQHEILMDSPWGYWPLNEPSGSRLAASISTGGGSNVNLFPVPPHRSGAATADFGASTELAGDGGTGWGQTAGDDDADNDQGWTLGSGIISGATFPSLAASGTVTTEVWAKYPVRSKKAAQSTLLVLKSSATSWADHAIAQVLISQQSTTKQTGNLWVQTWNGSGTATFTDTGARCYADDRWHHYVLTLTSGSITLWVDGVQVYTNARSIATTQIDTIDVGGSQDAWDATTIGIGAYAHLAVYGAALTSQRIAAHYSSGHDGFPEDSGSRVNRILTYAGWKGPRALERGSSVLAACSSISGQTAADALGDVSKWEMGLVYPDGRGRMRFRCRATRFGQTSKGTFGDGPGEWHYQPDIGFDYDPTYQVNDVGITREAPDGTQGVTEWSGDPNGTRAWYFTATLTQSIPFLSDAQAADRATFLYNLLSVPLARVRPITIDPSADPSLWPVALGAEIGNVYTVKRRPLGAPNTISLDVMISEIKHSVAPGSWKTTFTLLPAQTSAVTVATAAWRLGDPVQSVLGTTTIPGF